jgi:hypothetical protein
MIASTLIQITDTHLLTDPRRRLHGRRVAAASPAASSGYPRPGCGSRAAKKPVEKDSLSD